MARSTAAVPSRTTDSSAQQQPVRRDQILDATYRIIADEGLEGLRFAAVAAQVGINNSTLCYYFSSREALVRGVTDRLMERLRTSSLSLKASAASAAENALDELRVLFDELRRRVQDDPTFFVVITELALRAQRDPKIALIDAQRDNFWQRRITAVLERGVEQGIFRRKLDCETVALAVMVQMKGIAHHAAIRSRKSKELSSIVDEILAQVERRVLREETSGAKVETREKPGNYRRKATVHSS